MQNRQGEETVLRERRDGVVSCIRDKCTGSTQRGQWKSTRKCKSKKAHHFSVEKNCCNSPASTHMVWYVHTLDTLASLARYCVNGGILVGHISRGLDCHCDSRGGAMLRVCALDKMWSWRLHLTNILTHRAAQLRARASLSPRNCFAQ